MLGTINFFEQQIYKEIKYFVVHSFSNSFYKIPHDLDQIICNHY